MFNPSEIVYQGPQFDVQTTLMNLILEFNQPVGANKVVNLYETHTGAWANPSYASPINGTMVIVYNSTQAASRLYIYSNSGWHQTALT